MNTEEIAKKLVKFCQDRQWEEATEALYADDVVSVEPREMGEMPAEVQGVDKVCAKARWWVENHEVHSSEVTGPFVARDTFVVLFDIGVTDKNSGQRMQASEVGIYQVKNGKIVREEFLPLIGS